MRERPILFSAPMVLALLDGWKTQTRRVMKPQPDDPYNELRSGGSAWALAGPCPYGEPGDRLWVKETWRLGAWRDDGRVAIDYLASPEMNRTPWLTPPQAQFEKLKLKRESEDDCRDAVDANRGSGPANRRAPIATRRRRPRARWRPSIHMPRWASRLTLEVTGVRVERLQAISEADAIAEGVQRCGLPNDRHPLWKAGHELHEAAVPAYLSLWESINGARGRRERTRGGGPRGLSLGRSVMPFGVNPMTGRPGPAPKKVNNKRRGRG